MHEWDNQAIADKLLEIADLLEQQEANPFRVNAYRRAARTVAAHPEPIAALAEREGTEGLDHLPTIGRSIALGLAREGANVAICARNEEALRLAAAETA